LPHSTASSSLLLAILSLHDALPIFRLSAMGDVAMMVPVLKAFSEKFPNVKITLLTRGFFTPLFRELPNVEVFAAEVNGRHKGIRSEEHTSELQSRENLVCRLLLEKK